VFSLLSKPSIYSCPALVLDPTIGNGESNVEPKTNVAPH
jgi:hypothetical protein